MNRLNAETQRTQWNAKFSICLCGIPRSPRLGVFLNLFRLVIICVHLCSLATLALAQRVGG